MRSKSLLGLALAGLLFPQVVCAQAPAKVDGFTYVKSLDGIHEYTLDSNGLSVLLVPRHTAPVVTYQVTYRVGSRNETVGTTGGTHLLEHLMFKGSKQFNKEQANGVDNYLELHGAQFNATTSYDRTNYYATLSPDALEGYIAIEADRMRNLLLREKDRSDEMTVVRNEFEQNENDPSSVLGKELWSAAFVAHPYQNPIIGWRSDIENIPIEKLRKFYDTFYWPNNATVSVVGDVQPATALELIRKHYGAIPRSPQPIPAVYTTEPEQQGARRVVLKRAGQLGNVALLFKAPNARHADTPALDVLSLVLGSGENSRLYRALVDTNKAVYVSASMSSMHDPGAFGFDASLAPEVTHAEVEKLLLAEIEKVKRNGVTAAEIKRVLGPYRAEQAFQKDGTDNTAGALNEYIAMGDWTLYATGLASLEKVTPADVKRVANQYLVEDKSTTGWFVPNMEEMDEEAFSEGAQ